MEQNKRRKIDSIKKRGKQVIESELFGMALYGLTYAVPYATAPMIASKGKLLSKAGMVIKRTAPKVINAYIITRKEK